MLLVLLSLFYFPLSSIHFFISHAKGDLINCNLIAGSDLLVIWDGTGINELLCRRLELKLPLITNKGKGGAWLLVGWGLG